jgi:hypothetical protein
MMQRRFRWSHRIAPGVRMFIGPRSTRVRFRVKRFGVTTGTARTCVSREMFPGSGMFWSQRIGGTSLTVIVALVLVMVIALSCLGALTGCATVHSAATPSGKPEVTVHAAPAPVKSAILNQMTDYGFTLEKDSPDQMTFGRRGRNVRLAKWGYKVTYLITGEGAGVIHVVGDMALVEYPGTPEERPAAGNFEQGDSQEAVYRQIEQVLTSLKALQE